jgi:hypothetical protein
MEAGMGLGIGVIVLGVLMVAPLVAVLAVVAIVLAARRPSPAPSQAAEAARRHGATVNVLAWVAALVLGQLPVLAAGTLVFRATGGRDPYGAVLVWVYVTAPALVFLGVHALGERTWPRPTGDVRRAALAPRVAVAPRWLLRVTAGWGAALVVALILTGATAADGRAFTVAASGTASPYPGWYYGVPLLVSAAVIGVTTRGVLHLVARRPAVVDADPAYDAASRRLSAHRVLRGAQLVLALMIAGVLLVAGDAAGNLDLEPAGTLLLVVGVAVGLAGLAVSLVPGRVPVPSDGQDRSAAHPALPEARPTPDPEAPR